jgi:hypothetical protein
MAWYFGDIFMVAPFKAALLIPDHCSGEYLQCRDPIAVESEGELELDGTARKIPGKPIGDDGLAVFLSGCKRLDRVLVLLPGLSDPLLDGGQTLDCLAFVSHNGIFDKTLSQSLLLTAVRGRDISSNGCWKIDIHI